MNSPEDCVQKMGNQNEGAEGNLDIEVRGAEAIARLTFVGEWNDTKRAIDFEDKLNRDLAFDFGPQKPNFGDVGEHWD